MKIKEEKNKIISPRYWKPRSGKAAGRITHSASLGGSGHASMIFCFFLYMLLTADYDTGRNCFCQLRGDQRLTGRKRNRTLQAEQDKAHVTS